jgi:hypothetical protein
MAYDPNSLMGLDALSPTVGAYKQFVERQNGVNDAGVVPFLVSRGEPQLAGLIAKKMRVENAAKAQQQLAQQPPAAPPTVAQQYDQAAMQQAQQARMAQGLGGMPAPTMERASFAGGGIVAFADGGGVQHYANQGLVQLYNPAAMAQQKEATYRAIVNAVQQDLASGKITQAEALQKLQEARKATGSDISTPRQAENFSRDMGLTPATGSTTVGIGSLVKKPPAPVVPKPDAAPVADPFDAYLKTLKDAEEGKDEAFYIKEAEEKQKGLGRGAALADYEKLVAGLKDRYEGAGADRKNLKEAVIMGAAKLMTGKGGFNEALGAAFGTGTEAYYASKKANEKAALDLAKTTYELNDAKERLKLSAAQEGTAEYKKKVARIEDLEDKKFEHQVKLEEQKRQDEEQMKRLQYEQQQLNYRAQKNIEALAPGRLATADATKLRIRLQSLARDESVQKAILTDARTPLEDAAKAQRRLAEIAAEADGINTLLSTGGADASTSATMPSGGAPMSSGTTSTGTKYQILGG